MTDKEFRKKEVGTRMLAAESVPSFSMQPKLAKLWQTIQTDSIIKQTDTTSPNQTSTACKENLKIQIKRKGPIK